MITFPNGIDDYLSSYQGMAGGNIDAPIWFCAIEPGGCLNRDTEQRLVAQVAWPCWDDAYLLSNPEFIRWKFDVKVAKIMNQVTASTSNWRDYRTNRLYRADGAECKLNLFPLPCPCEADWPYQLDLGYSKDGYRNRYRTVRFEFLRKLRNDHRPSVIVGVGRGHSVDFREAFGFQASRAPNILHLSDGKHAEIYLDTDATLVVTPHFSGAKGLNSDASLGALAKVLMNLLDSERLISFGKM